MSSAPGRTMTWVALAVSVVALVLLIVGFIIDPSRALAAYLVAFAGGVAVALGALALIMIGHVLTAHWFLVLRRLAEAVAVTIPLLALLFVPLLLDLHALYAWVPPLADLTPELRASVLAKGAYLNVPFFLARTAFYFAVWTVMIVLLVRWSLQQDLRPSDGPTHKQRALSAAGLPVLALTSTFAAFDWLMSLSPGWYSTIYGVYYFAAGMVGILGLLAFLALRAEISGALAGVVKTSHYHQLGNMLLTFVIFWAYIAFAQLLIIWIGNLPAEIVWLEPRLHTSWAILGVILFLGMFALPFLALLFRDLKRNPRILAAVGLWLVITTYLDVYWLVMPELHPAGLAVRWVDLAAPAFVGGAMVALGSWHFHRHPATPFGDPEYRASLDYTGD